MSQRHPPRSLGVDGSAAVPRQWLWRTVVGMVALGGIGFVGPRLGLTTLSPSQLIDRFLAVNHTVPTLGTNPSVWQPSPLPGGEIAITLVGWSLSLFVICCALATFVAAGRYNGARWRRVSAEDNEGDA